MQVAVETKEREEGEMAKRCIQVKVKARGSKDRFKRLSG